MPLPWIRLIDGIIGAADVVRVVRRRATPPEAPASSAMEVPLVGVVVSALREAFNRDHERMALERQRLEEEQARAERALLLELLRQAGERELSRLRLLIGVAVLSLLGSLVFFTRLIDGAAVERAALGAGWVLLIAALAAAFSGQQHVVHVLAGVAPHTTIDEVTRSPGGRAAPWLIVGGLGAVALGALVA